MRFRHVALYRWSEHVDQAHIERVGRAFDELGAHPSGPRRLAHGADAGVSDGSYDYLVVADFDSVVEWRAWRESPTYLLLHEELITGYATERAGGQYHLGGHGDVSGASPGAAIASDSDPVGAEMSDDELLERARRAAVAEMQSLLAEPDDIDLSPGRPDPPT